jgi:hypothetical protein
MGFKGGSIEFKPDSNQHFPFQARHGWLVLSKSPTLTTRIAILEVLNAG